MLAIAVVLWDGALLSSGRFSRLRSTIGAILLAWLVTNDNATLSFIISARQAVRFGAKIIAQSARALYP
ncbi:hypothetical protein, partial [Mesorhizobium sp. M7A.F.Ca.US.007.01.2.1]|uniref:hypothetical protein n=1 Tax=Mesorhizobium sp. M7A.F.Ca.US.007.01.2.1 TaxID=2496711 RepID=UPI0019CFE761